MQERIVLSPGLMGFGVREAVHVGRSIDFHEILHHRDGDLRAPDVAATCPADPLDRRRPAAGGTGIDAGAADADDGVPDAAA
jgi:hypothetical protein